MGLERIVEPVAYGAAPDAANYWRVTEPGVAVPTLEGEAKHDFAVIGAGFTGLSAASRLAEQGADVAVIDAEGPGWGASGRNGGFCCLGGSALSDDTLEKRYGEASAKAYYDAERAAVDHVAQALDQHEIDAERHSEGETLLAHTPKRVEELTEQAEKIKHRYGVTSRILPREELAQHGLASQEFHGAVTVPIGFALNPAKYAAGLAGAVQRAGGAIYGDSMVERIEDDDRGYTLVTQKGRLRAKRVILATNGYSAENLPEWMRGRYLPTQSNILVTRPMSDDEIASQGWTSAQMCYDTRYHLHYFRLMPERQGETGRRMLFGVRGRVRSTREVWRATRDAARADFERIFPQWRHVETPHFWQGLLCLSRKLTPFAGAIPGTDGMFAALAYHGNGVAMGSYAGRLVADCALGRPGVIPEVMAAPLTRFPLGRHRRWLLWGAWHLHRAQDVLGLG